MTKQEIAKKIAKIHRKYNKEIVNKINTTKELDDFLRAYAISIGDWFIKEIEKEFSMSLPANCVMIS